MQTDWGLVATATAQGIKIGLCMIISITAKLFWLLELQQNLKKDFLSMSICGILCIIVQAIKICLALIFGAIQLVLKWIKLVLKCANPGLKSPN